MSGSPAVIEGPFQVSQSDQYVTEWARPTITHGPSLVVTGMVVFVAIVWLVKRRGATWFNLAVLASALFWDWYALRTIVRDYQQNVRCARLFRGSR